MKLSLIKLSTTKKYNLGVQSLTPRSSPTGREATNAATSAGATGAGIGSTVGGTVGQFFGPLGQMIGSAAGSILGGVTGGLIGGQKGKNEKLKKMSLRQSDLDSNAALLQQNLRYGGGEEATQTQDLMSNSDRLVAKHGMEKTPKALIEVEKDELIFREVKPDQFKLVADFKGGKTHEEGGEPFIAKEGDIIFPGKMRNGVKDLVVNNYIKDTPRFKALRDKLPPDNQEKDWTFEKGCAKYSMPKFKKGTSKLSISKFGDGTKSTGGDGSKNNIKERTQRVYNQANPETVTKEYIQYYPDGTPLDKAELDMQARAQKQAGLSYISSDIHKHIMKPVSLIGYNNSNVNRNITSPTLEYPDLRIVRYGPKKGDISYFPLTNIGDANKSLETGRISAGLSIFDKDKQDIIYDATKRLIEDIESGKYIGQTDTVKANRHFTEGDDYVWRKYKDGEIVRSELAFSKPKYFGGAGALGGMMGGGSGGGGMMSMLGGMMGGGGGSAPQQSSNAGSGGGQVASGAAGLGTGIASLIGSAMGGEEADVSGAVGNMVAGVGGAVGGAFGMDNAGQGLGNAIAGAGPKPQGFTDNNPNNKPNPNTPQTQPATQVPQSGQAATLAGQVANTPIQQPQQVGPPVATNQPSTTPNVLPTQANKAGSLAGMAFKNTPTNLAPTAPAVMRNGTRKLVARYGKGVNEVGDPEDERRKQIERDLADNLKDYDDMRSMLPNPQPGVRMKRKDRLALDQRYSEVTEAMQTLIDQNHELKRKLSMPVEQNKTIEERTAITPKLTPQDRTPVYISPQQPNIERPNVAIPEVEVPQTEMSQTEMLQYQPDNQFRFGNQLQNQNNLNIEDSFKQNLDNVGNPIINIGKYDDGTKKIGGDQNQTMNLGGSNQPVQQQKAKLKFKSSLGGDQNQQITKGDLIGGGSNKFNDNDKSEDNLRRSASSAIRHGLGGGKITDITVSSNPYLQEEAKKLGYDYDYTGKLTKGGGGSNATEFEAELPVGGGGGSSLGNQTSNQNNLGLSDAFKQTLSNVGNPNINIDLGKDQPQATPQQMAAQAAQQAAARDQDLRDREDKAGGPQQFITGQYNLPARDQQAAIFNPQALQLSQQNYQDQSDVQRGEAERQRRLAFAQSRNMGAGAGLSNMQNASAQSFNQSQQINQAEGLRADQIDQSNLGIRNAQAQYNNQLFNQANETNVAEMIDTENKNLQNRYNIDNSNFTALQHTLRGAGQQADWNRYQNQIEAKNAVERQQRDNIENANYLAQSAKLGVPLEQLQAQEKFMNQARSGVTAQDAYGAFGFQPKKQKQGVRFKRIVY